MGSSAKSIIVDNESEWHLIGRWNGTLLCDLLAYLIKLIVDQLPLKEQVSVKAGLPNQPDQADHQNCMQKIVY